MCYIILTGSQVIQCHFHCGISLREKTNNILTIGGGAGQHIQIYATTQYMAVLMVGVVSADFSTPRTTEQYNLTHFIL